MVAVLTLSVAPVSFAYDYPRAFWDANSKYVTSYNSRDYNGVIKYGEEILNLIGNLPDTTEKRDIMISRHDAVGEAYAKLGNYDKSAEHYKAILNYATETDPTYSETVRGAVARATQYESRLQVYVDNGQETYYGARNENKKKSVSWQFVVERL